jgi:hypothetical protein
LETFLELPNGIPSHDTFGCVFARLDPERFQACFLSWVQAINTVLPAKPIAIDGNDEPSSHDRDRGKAAIQMVRAWAAETHLVLAQRHVKEHSNEQTALPRLVEQLELAGCLPKIATQIKAQDGITCWRSKATREPCIKTWWTCLPMCWQPGLLSWCMTRTTP